MSSNKEVYAVCICGFFDFQPLRKSLAVSYSLNSYRNVIQIQPVQGEVYIFDYGVAVFWSVPISTRDTLLTQIMEFSQEALSDKLVDEFTYETNAKQSSLKNDHICLHDDDFLTRLAISQGIAQSTKLEQYEARVLHTIASTEYIPENIAKTGKSGLRRIELAKLRGYLFLTKSDVMLHFDLLDVPEFFWEYPELQSYYTLIADYLEIKQRIEVLNKKLETIHDLLSMIVDEQQHAHSSMLEWIIIALFTIDIVILLAQEFL